MNTLDQIIADALAGSPETHVSILAREVVRLREARGVVVPELTRRQSTDIANEAQMITGRSIWPSTVEAIAKIMRLRAIPADRVLGEGMRQVDAKIFAKSVDDLHCLVNCAAMNHWDGELMRDAYAAIDALRANQGGADHD